jgi:hypothetical protein
MAVRQALQRGLLTEGQLQEESAASALLRAVSRLSATLACVWLTTPS